jgi:hypothetical protein
MARRTIRSGRTSSPPTKSAFADAGSTHRKIVGIREPR